MVDRRVLVVSILALLAVTIVAGGIYTGKISISNLPGNQLVSVSQVNLQPGGSIQNSYVIGTYWDFVLTVSQFQTLSLIKTNFGSLNNSGLQNNLVNGQTVYPTSQIFVTITPLQPYASLTLVPESLKYAQSASGYGSPSQTGFGALISQQVSAQAQTMSYFVPNPNNDVWQYHYPVLVNVFKPGVAPTGFNVTQQIDTAAQTSVTISNPLNSQQQLTINNLGNFVGNFSPPPLPTTNTVFYQYPFGNLWFGFNNALNGIQSGFQNYWYGTTNSFTQSGGEQTGNYQPDPAYWPGSIATLPSPGSGNNVLASCPPSVHPGWQQTAVLPLVNPSQSPQYFYAPIAPQEFGNSVPASTQFSQIGSFPFNQYRVTTQTCQQLSLTTWLGYAGYSQYSFSPYGLGNWGSINQTTLVENLSPSVINPVIQLLVSTSLVDTYVYQQNNAAFKIGSVSIGSPSVQAGSFTTLTAVINNVGTYTGTATVQAITQLGKFSVSPPTQTPVIQAGQSATITFTVTGLSTQAVATDSINLIVTNSYNVVQDQKSISVTDTPQTVTGNPNFVFVPFSQPAPLTKGNNEPLVLNIKNLGASGAGTLVAASESPLTASIVPSNQTITLGSGTTGQATFYIYAINAVNPQNVTLDFSIIGGSNSQQSTKATVLILPPNSTCQFTASCTNNGFGSILVIIAVIGIIAAVGVGLFIAYRRTSPVAQ